MNPIIIYGIGGWILATAIGVAVLKPFSAGNKKVKMMNCRSNIKRYKKLNSN